MQALLTQMGRDDLSPESLTGWLQLYMELEGSAGSPNTTEAKERDLAALLNFLRHRGVRDLPDLWTPVVTGAFLAHLRTQGKSPLTVNRVLATLRRAATWIDQQRPFLAGPPCARVRNLQTEEPEWKGLTDEEIARLRQAAEEGIRESRGGFPVRDYALFLVLLHTGLRISELLALDLRQWEGTHLRDVSRKGQVVTRRVFLASDAQALLRRYVEEERGPAPGALFCSRSGKRLVRQNANGILKRLAARAERRGPETITISAHVLRHTMLRRVAEKHGVAYAKELSGHVSDYYIWRYVKPSQEDKERALEGLFES